MHFIRQASTRLWVVTVFTWTALALLTGWPHVISHLLAEDAKATATRPWSSERANEWYQEQPWIVGCNFIPSTAVNWTEMWQKETFDPETIDRELGYAAELGMNTVRVFFQFLVWEFDRKGFGERFEQFLTIAAEHKIAVVPVFFDDCMIGVCGSEPFMGKQPDPLPDRMFSSWVPSPGHMRSEISAQFPLFREYVQSIMRRHSKDRRVLMWDLFNEVGGHNRQKQSFHLLQESFAWAQEVDPDQPITACLMAWQDARFAEIVKLLSSQSDVISFHSYEGEKAFREHIEQMQAYGRPVVCSEWLARGPGSLVETHLPLMKEHNIGAINWGLVNGRSNTHIPWGVHKPPPKLWHHDLFNGDGTPYNEAEVDVFRKLTRVKQRL